MREIKFRGKQIDNGEWVYGYLVNIGKYYSPSDESSCYIVTGVQENNRTWVDPKTVGQFTGHHDKNGKEIYRGSICIMNKDQKVFVDWDDNEGGFVWRIIGKKSFWSWHWAKDIEVIGNIHENPELLK